MKEFLQKCKHSSWAIFVVFAFTIFFKCILFHYFCFNYVAVSSLWEAPADFFAFYFSKLMPAVFIASFVFITKRHWWTVVMSVLIDLWLIANLIYYRANDLFFDVEIILMADNMSGFWQSIKTYIKWEYMMIFATSLLYFFLIVKIGESSRKIKMFACSLGIWLVLSTFLFVFGTSSKEEHVGLPGWRFNGFKFVDNVAQGNFSEFTFVCNSWIETQTPLDWFPTWLYWECKKNYYKGKFSQAEFSDEEFAKIRACKVERTPCIAKYNLILVIGESFESWPIGLVDEKGKLVLPNITRIAKNEHVLYSSTIRSQASRGSSGDGQMIINTGLLPIAQGAACMLYGKNVYPNVAGLYKNSCVVNPAPRVWNQQEVTYSYGYKTLVEKQVETYNSGDTCVIRMALDVLSKLKDSLFCIMPITISTHTPFNYEGVSSLSFPKDVPETLKNYLNCMHYADSCIGEFLNKLERDSLLQNTTVVITGDHTIFKSALLREFQPFAQKYHYPIPAEESYCPLIIYSPNIEGHIEISELCYQMDIFPTILHCIGADNYYWKGFGVNLLDSVALRNRTITEEEAYMLSDKMIRSNYFKTLEGNQN